MAQSWFTAVRRMKVFEKLHVEVQTNINRCYFVFSTWSILNLDFEQAKPTAGGSESVCVCVLVCVRETSSRREIPPSLLPIFLFISSALPSRGRGPRVVVGSWSVSAQDGVFRGDGGRHVLSFRMTVARIRKNVFQPRVTAKPRHTIISDIPQPGQKIAELAAR